MGYFESLARQGFQNNLTSRVVYPESLRREEKKRSHKAFFLCDRSNWGCICVSI